MASTSTRIFNSSSDGQRWADQITPMLSNPEAFRARPSIFVVPKALSAVNPEAYIPRLVGMGPYHHLRPDLYALEGDKLQLAKMVLQYIIPTLEVQHLVAKLKELDSEIRASYKEYLDLPPDVLALIIAIDSLFLLGILERRSNQNLGAYLRYSFAKDRNLKMDDIHGDLFMLENQIPINLLMGIFNRSDGDHYSSSPGSELDHKDLESGEIILLSPTILVSFCKEHCPLEFIEQRTSDLAGNCKHFLDFMYSSIVHFHGLEILFSMSMSRPMPCHIALDCAALIVHCSAPTFGTVSHCEQIVGLLQKILQIIQNMPWDRIFLLFRELNENSGKSKSQDVKIPSASQLSSVGVEIILAPKIRDIRFDEERRRPTLYLPLITLNGTSKVVLRNLVAYEASIAFPGDKCQLALYAFLMSGIIRAAEDVKLLEAKGVVKVKGGLSNGEVADIFKGICKPSTQSYEKSKLEETIENVYKFYNGQWKVKARKFARASWRVLKIVFKVLVIFALCLKVFCNAFDCPRISWKSPGAIHLALQIQ